MTQFFWTHIIIFSFLNFNYCILILGKNSKFKPTKILAFFNGNLLPSFLPIVCSLAFFPVCFRIYIYYTIHFIQDQKVFLNIFFLKGYMQIKITNTKFLRWRVNSPILPFKYGSCCIHIRHLCILLTFAKVCEFFLIHN